MSTDVFGIPIDLVIGCLQSFPLEYQMDILQEEAAELIQACSKLKRKPSQAALQLVKEEMAHVLMSTAVTAKLYGIKREDILNELYKKADAYGVEYVKENER